jgi:manganese transport protein
LKTSPPSLPVAEQPPITTGKSTHRAGNWLRSLGPGIITAAIVFGPSKMTITSKLGAQYGFAMLWLVIVAMYFMVLFTSMASRIGLSTQQSLLSLIRDKWGNKAALIIGIGIFLVTASFQAGNSIGVGIAVAEITHTPSYVWVIVFNIVGIGLLFLRSFYKVLEKLMIFMVTLMLLAFIITLFMIKPDPTAVISGIIPSVPAGAQGLMIAFMASCFSIVAAFYQAYLVQERNRLNPNGNNRTGGSNSGMIILGLLVAIVMICAGTVLHSQGIAVNTAVDMAKALQPLFGQYAEKLFLAGLFAAGFSALVGNASIGGTLLGDAFGLGYRLQLKPVKYLISLVMVTGAIVAIVFGKLPLQLIVMAQSVTIFVVPFIGFAMYFVANDRKIMGPLKNTRYQNIMCGVGLAVIVLLALLNVKEIFIK